MHRIARVAFESELAYFVTLSLPSCAIFMLKILFFSKTEQPVKKAIQFVPWGYNLVRASLSTPPHPVLQKLSGCVFLTEQQN